MMSTRSEESSLSGLLSGFGLTGVNKDFEPS